MFALRIRKSFPWLAIGLCVAAHQPSAAQSPGAALERDLWQTVQARKLLLDDPQLGPLNLGVKVNSRIAVLWGPVPSADLAALAERRLRVMYELLDIRNGLTVEGDDLVPPVPLSDKLIN